MKAITIEINGKQKLAALSNDEVIIDLQEAQSKRGGSYRVPETMIEAASEGALFWDEITKIVNWSLKNQVEDCLLSTNSANVTLKAPIPRPTKNIICAGKNYADHAAEMGSTADIPQHPIIFTKSPTTVIGSDETINPHLNVTKELDYEGEIAVVVGKQGIGIKKEDAQNHIFGYTLLNDVTARDLQTQHKQFFLGKSLDTFCPMGPSIVSADALKEKDISLNTYVNGELRQKTTTEDMIFSIASLMEVISRGMTLEPGDIIATGTPAGVGKGFNPPRYLEPGDEILIQAQGLGELRNEVLKK
ncbi:2-keto-4-pentenoate hydratase/2-oxohepta-3-ene-1,7-dioic acid hydratase in catechol pathway [Salibacterium salarium]|uniref:fumarylacetoacetate hydrolase family protein n=1 Tax=Salibacterium salarium TaxID=284579 RepID=UPI00277EEFB9|nr:fumarylacetoacetate hydrolase family protein [Salibacterium salarium]MDQ0298771.1 2-keto-4-pentenoate hydratase/2-oxohepta-3-ene-1,7-dioic acid hydratase in catechol pathway [Salibacterium salarium]